MPRIRPLNKNEVSEAIRSLLEATEDHHGRSSDSAGIQAYCPPILEASRALGSAPTESDVLPTELISLVCIRVAQIVTCPS